MIFYLPIILMILGTTFYHIAQKSVPRAGQPHVLAGAMNYITALNTASALLLVAPRHSSPSSRAGSPLPHTAPRPNYEC